MFFSRCRILAVLTGCCLVRGVPDRMCRQEPSLCRDDQLCCLQERNDTAVTCCKGLADKTYHNIAMITRKLSGVLIMLLLFAVGYFVQRLLCSRSGQRAPARSGHHDAVTASREALVEICSPTGAATPAPAAQPPTYDACKRLPTYEETVRDHERGGPSRAS